MIAKILHILFAFLVLLSSIGITVKKHYCQNKLENVSFLPTSSCCKTAKHHACKKSDTDCKKGCCSNELEYIHLDQDFQVQKVNAFSLDQIKIAAIFTAVFEVDLTHITAIKNYTNYKPPIIRSDISVLFQVFRL
ncbi:MAG: hypothetical protein ACI9XO_003495 [Paraglaciecola sp.]